MAQLTGMRPRSLPSEVEESQTNRHGRRRWVAAALALVVVGTATWQIWGRSYEPLATGMFGVRGARYTVNFGRKLAYEHGREFLYFFDVQNAGDRTVTITGIVLPLTPDRHMEVLVEQRGLLMSEELNSQFPPVPFAPFELPAHEWRTIFVKAGFANCRGWGPNEFMAIDSHVVRYSFLGIESRTDLRFISPLIVPGPARADCPPAQSHV